jgi:hypothetical protein
MLSFKSDKETQHILIERGPYFKTPNIGQHGWVSIRCVEIGDWDGLSELIVEAYLHTTPAAVERRP